MDITRWTDSNKPASFRLPGSNRTHRFIEQPVGSGHTLIALACGVGPAFGTLVPTDEAATCPRCSKVAA
jgi:hypothetical protein